jgi:RND family efflux transporter MFP subunit
MDAFNRRASSSRRVLFALAALVAPALSGLAAAAQEGEVPAAAATEPQGLPVIEQTIIDDKAVFATVRSSDTAEARARLSGTVTALKVDEGSQVTRGQLVATIVDDKLRLQEGSTEAAIKAAQARLVKAAADLKRGQDLLKRGVVAKATVDEYQAAYDVANNDLKSAQAQQSVLREQMNQGDVLAPADGRVLKVPVTKGSVVLAGESLASIAANQYILRLELPERHARYIKKGDTVMVGARGLDPQEKAVGEGIISQVYPELQDGRVIADVEIANLGDYFVGERALVRIAADKREAIVIPKDYSFKRYGLDYVKLARNGGEPIDVVVQLGGPVLLGRGKGGIEVLAGLRSGDRLIKPTETSTNP